MNDLWLLTKLRCQLVAQRLREIRNEPRLKIVVVVVLGLSLWVGLFLGFYGGFRFLDDFPGLRALLLEYLFAIFFFTLFVMLIFSNSIIIFSGLYRSREAGFLLSQPLSHEHVFVYKLVEALLFSSWAVVFVGVPLMLAYGITTGVTWSYYPVTAVFFLWFIMLPAGLGALIALGLGRYFPLFRSKWAKLALLVALLALGFLAYRVMVSIRTLPAMTEIWLRGILKRLAFARNALLPSYWMSEGVLALVKRNFFRSVFFLLVIVSNALMLLLVAYHFARRSYGRSYSLAQRGSGRRRRGQWQLITRFINRLFFFLPPEARLLLVKDAKVFLRDPVQWSQFLIFFGLLAIYFFNIRRFYYHVQVMFWRNLIAFVNLATTSLILATFTSRFVFPLVSLEGQKFWILGLSPISRRVILWGKFLFAFLGTFLISEGLILVSCAMLRLPWQIVVLHMATVMLVCAGLSGIAVGLGATYPNLKEDNPSKIVSGFGGTLCLVASLLFISLVIAVEVVPCHLYFVRQMIGLASFGWWLALSLLIVLAAGVLAAALPMYVGIRAFSRMEF